MPYTAVKERQRSQLTHQMKALLLLLAVTAAPTPLDTVCRKRKFWDLGEEHDEWQKAEDDYEEELLVYAVTHGALKKQRSAKHSFTFHRKTVTAAMFSEGNFRQKFRFEQRDFAELLRLLRVPPVMKTPKRDRFTGEEALLLYLCRCLTLIWPHFL